MSRRYAITTLAALGLVAAGSLFAAAASAEDTMKPDHMKSGGIRADKMNRPHGIAGNEVRPYGQHTRIRPLGRRSASGLALERVPGRATGDEC